MTRRIILVGYYGRNLGDIAMLDSLAKIAKRECIDIAVYSYANETSNGYYDKNGFDIKSIKGNGRVNGLICFAKDVLRADGVVWGGGTCFMDEGGEGGIKYMLIARILGAKVGYFGIGIGSYNKFKTKIAVNIAKIISSFICVRDFRSLAIVNNRLESDKYSLIPDPIYSMAREVVSSNSFEVNDDFKPGYLLVAYRDLGEYCSNDVKNKWLQDFIGVVSEYLHSNAENTIVITSIDNNVDFNDSKIIYEGLGCNERVTFVKNATFEDHLNLIRNAMAILTGRLHVGVLGILLNKPLLLLNYSPKNEEFLSEIDRLECLIEYHELRTMNISNRYMQQNLEGKDVISTIVDKKGACVELSFVHSIDIILNKE